MTGKARRHTTSELVKRDAPAFLIIVEKCGGITQFCEMTGFVPGTVHHWLRSGLIPAKWYEPGLSYQRFIIESAKANGVRVTPADFIEK